MNQSMSWQELFTKLRPVLEAGSKKLEANKDNVLRWLRQYQANRVDFQAFCFSHQRGYTKNLVQAFGDESNVIVMCWLPGQMSAIHGHEGSKCFVKILSGELLEQRIPYPKSECFSTQDKNEKLLKLNDVCYIDDSIGLHKMTNKSAEESAVSLHIYLPAYRKCRIFNATTARDELMLKGSNLLDVTFDTTFNGYQELVQKT